MHLRAISLEHRHLEYVVWLEDKGRRIFKHGPRVPPQVWKCLKEEIENQRQRIEELWACYMMMKGWLTVGMAGTAVTLDAYPNTPSNFQREIDLVDLFAADYVQSLNPEDVELNLEMACLVIGPRELDFGPGKPDCRNHLPISKFLWTN
jgi:hypothetical protein